MIIFEPSHNKPWLCEQKCADQTARTQMCSLISTIFIRILCFIKAFHATFIVLMIPANILSLAELCRTPRSRFSRDMAYLFK